MYTGIPTRTGRPRKVLINWAIRGYLSPKIEAPVFLLPRPGSYQPGRTLAPKAALVIAALLLSSTAI